MKNQPLYYWDCDAGLATCILTDGNNTFYGMAQCHEDDRDMMSEKTGYEIAYRRALIEALRHRVNNDLKPQIKILKEVYYTMVHSKNYNKKSYESKMLFRKLKQLEEDLATTKQIIKEEKEYVKNYIDAKDIFYKKIRSARKGESIVKVFGQN